MVNKISESNEVVYLDPSQEFSKRVCPPIQGVEVYPDHLYEAITRIQRCVPEMFSILPVLLKRSIKILVEVEVPVSQNGYVALSALIEKNISIPGLRAKKQVHENQLMEKGIAVRSNAPFVAHWNYESCTLALRHSYYDHFSEGRRIFFQIGSLLFELQNAQWSQEFHKIWSQGAQQTKEEFVKRLEEIEFTTHRLTANRLSDMAKHEEFDENFNQFRFMYEHFPLYYLHQQAMNHSQAYAKSHDARYKTALDHPYCGTWAVPFPVPSISGELHVEQTSVSKILTHHLDAIYGLSASYRAEYERRLHNAVDAVKQSASEGDQGAQNVIKNLRFFQEEYNQYVIQAKPSRVVNLLTKIAQQAPIA